MIRTVILAIFASLALAACQPMTRIVVVPGSAPAGVHALSEVITLHDPKSPVVVVDEEVKRIVVDQEPIYARDDPHDSTRKLVVWRVDPKYDFADVDPVVICPESTGPKACSKPPGLKCDWQNPHSRKRYMCSWTKPQPGARIAQYFYTIRLKDSSISMLDPSIMN